jgi:hypothetical protein
MPGLVRDEVREEIRENAKQRQTANAVCGQNPGSAAFMMFGGSRGLLGVGRRDDRGPIFHAKKPPDGKIVAQVLYASRLPRVMGRQDYLGGILLRIQGVWEKKSVMVTGFLRKLAVKMGKTLPEPSF